MHFEKLIPDADDASAFGLFEFAAGIFIRQQTQDLLSARRTRIERNNEAAAAHARRLAG